jgi:hypothetical protein
MAKLLAINFMYRLLKNLFFILLVTTFVFFGCNKKPLKDKTSKDIYLSYHDKGVGSVFSVPPGLASVFLDEEQPGNLELKDLLSDINNLTFLIIPNNSDVKESTYYSEIDGRLDDINFQNLAVVNTGNEIVKVKVLNQDTEDISEMIILVSNYETLFCISFRGNINIQKITNLTKPENMVAVTNLNRFK